MGKPKLLRITTVPISLHLLLRGQFRYMREQGYDVYTVSASGKEVDAVRSEGAIHESIPFTRKITPIQDLKCLWQLIVLIRKVRPAIVHTHTPKAGLLGMMAAWFCRVPVRMHTVAGLPLMESTGLKRKVLVATERATYFCSQYVYPNSEGLRTYMRQSLRVNNSKMKIIGKGSSNGINSSFFMRTPELENERQRLREQYGIEPHDVVFSFVGRIVRDKGIGELISAFRKIESDTSTQQRVFLLLIGPFEQELDPLDSEDYAYLHNSKNVILAGFQQDVRPWIMASEVFVFPSYREGFPNVVMQASCLEVPCIVSDINGCNEIVKHNASGLIVPVKNAEALYQPMRRMAEDVALRKKFATAAREHVVANFDQRYVWKALQNEYETLLVNNK